MSVGEQQRDVRAHRMSDDDDRPTDLVDHGSDVVGVLAQPDRSRLGPTATAAAEVDRHDDSTSTGELMRPPDPTTTRWP